MEVSASPGVVNVTGDLDVRSVAAVRQVLVAVMDSTSGDVVLDLSGVDILDVTGLGMIAAAHRRAEREGRQLLLRGCHGAVRRILALTRLGRVMHMEHEPISA